MKTDVAAAKKLVSDAGATGASVKMLQYNVEPQNTLAKVAQAQLQQIGLNVELVPILSTLGRATFRAGGYGLLTVSITSPATADPTGWTDQYVVGIENPGTKDPALGALIDKARTNPLGSKERETAFRDVNKALTDDPIWASMCQIVNTFIGSKRILGMDSMPGAALTLVPDMHYLQIAKSK